MGFDIQKAVEPYLGEKYYFDQSSPDEVVFFIESYCRVTKDGALFKAGELMEVQDWQKEIIYPVFGVKRKEDGRRRFQYVWNELPKKNGKSGLLSALSLYLLGPGGETTGLGYGAANTKEQAKLIMKDAKDMISMDEVLSDAYTVKQYSIEYEKNNSVYQVVSADSSGLHGANLSFTFYDEIHAGEVDDQIKKLWDALRKSIVTRENPLIWVITNSGIKGTFPYHLHDYAKKVEDGLITDDRWFVKTYNAPEDCDIYAESVFDEVNPGYGSVIPRRYWEDEVQEIKNNPLAVSVWKRLHLGIWVSTTSAWSLADIWDRANKSKHDISDFRGHKAILGIDLADSRDLCSCAIIIPPPLRNESGEVVLFGENKNEDFAWFDLTWCPSSTVDQRLRDESLFFKHWIEEGYVRVTSGDFRDSETIAADIISFCDGLDVVGVGFDRAKSDVVIPRLMEHGWECLPWPQTPYAMTMAVDKMDELITNGEVNHAGNPLLEWQIGNCQLYADREVNRWVHKTKSTGKIDGIVAFLNGIKQYLEMVKDIPTISDFEFEWV